ncbi:hypothetical protein DICVIV_13752 [Dictyocaulus viviparus]|uniref:Uncharacterized protein n=1 Tax=Dictyocaulus viviparus TaxID=29172 RepID=A0A0D8X982_DICVI|nr:hypothetical protein DICVIV_13752 [Dictyocaulus viviparus]
MCFLFQEEEIMPLAFLNVNYNLTHDDIEKVEMIKKTHQEQLTYEEVQTVVLAVLLIVTVIVLLTATGFKCYSMNCCGCNPRHKRKRGIRNSLSTSLPSSLSATI